ncbi:MAG TPA: hypothetical protein VGL46_08120 [Pseudonocardiaceae bacterium]
MPSAISQLAEPPRKAANRRVLHLTCLIHGGAAGYTNLTVSKRDGTIELDPHVAANAY